MWGIKRTQLPTLQVSTRNRCTVLGHSKLWSAEARAGCVCICKSRRNKGGTHSCDVPTGCIHITCEKGQERITILLRAFLLLFSR